MYPGRSMDEMGDEGVGLLAAIALGVVGLFVVIAAIGGVMYLADAKVGAEVIDKRCGSLPTGSSSTVVVETKFPIPGIEHTVKQMDNNSCQALVEGRSYAEYHLRSERVVLYEREGGRCLYDSDSLVC